MILSRYKMLNSLAVKVLEATNKEKLMILQVYTTDIWKENISIVKEIKKEDSCGEKSEMCQD